MASQLKTLYEELQRAFYAQPSSDLKKCAAVLTQLKVKSLYSPSIPPHVS